MDSSMDIIVAEIRQRVETLKRMGRTDLILQSVGVSTVEELRKEAAKQQLSRLVITPDYRFLLADLDKEVDLLPLHKAVYLLFLNHPEGIEFKNMIEYKQELHNLYCKITNRMDLDKIEESIDRLTNPLDNAINEKCSRIKKAFADLMDPYAVSFYAISSHGHQPLATTGKVWYRRLKVIKLPRHIVEFQTK